MLRRQSECVVNVASEGFQGRISPGRAAQNSVYLDNIDQWFRSVRKYLNLPILLQNLERKKKTILEERWLFEKFCWLKTSSG